MDGSYVFVVWDFGDYNCWRRQEQDDGWNWLDGRPAGVGKGKGKRGPESVRRKDTNHSDRSICSLPAL
jgi:hypothetical protein